jgi:hypothetical protein
MSLCVGVQAAGASELGIEVTFDDAEIETIRAYYRDHGSNDGHGNKHGKAKGLPPGIAKNLQRGKPLPPGIAKQNLPNDLILELPPLPSGYERIIIVGKILIVEISTQIIHDVLSDILLD